MSASIECRLRKGYQALAVGLQVSLAGRKSAGAKFSENNLDLF